MAFKSTSAIGYYAFGGPHTENSHVKADSFLDHLAQDWENEALQTREFGIRTVIIRFGVVPGKPTIMQVPKFVLRLQLGEWAQVLTEGQNILPERLLTSGFRFSFYNIEDAVKDCVA